MAPQPIVTKTATQAKGQTVRNFLDNPQSVFGLPNAINPGHMLPSSDLTGAPVPLTKAGIVQAWNAAITSWFNGFTVLTRKRSTLE